MDYKQKILKSASNGADPYMPLLSLLFYGRIWGYMQRISIIYIYSLDLFICDFLCPVVQN